MVVFLLIGVGAGSQISPQHKVSTTLFVEALILAFLYLVGLTAWLGIAINAALIVFAVIIGVLVMMQENKTIIGGA